MNIHVKLGVIVAAACTSLTLAGPVVNLDPGDFTADLSGITNTQMSELIGTVEFDSYQDISVYGGEPVQGDDGGMLYDATLMTRVARSNETGNLMFYFRIMDSNADLNGQISHLEISGFSGFQTRVEYRGEEGFGDVGPSIAARSLDGDLLTFDFNSTLATDQSSKFFFVMLDIAEFDYDGILPQATVYLQSGHSITLDIMPPVPAPGSLALLGTAGLCFARRRR